MGKKIGKVLMWVGCVLGGLGAVGAAVLLPVSAGVTGPGSLAPYIFGMSCLFGLGAGAALALIGAAVRVASRGY